MLRKSRKALVGFSFFAILAVTLTYLIWSTLQRSVSGDTDKYSATFADVQGLRVGDDIRMAGVRVGRVDRISRTPTDQAHVDFEIQHNQHLYTNTTALVRYQNLIGQRYVALEPGSGAAAPLPWAGRSASSTPSRRSTCRRYCPGSSHCSVSCSRIR